MAKIDFDVLQKIQNQCEEDSMTIKECANQFELILIRLENVLNRHNKKYEAILEFKEVTQ